MKYAIVEVGGKQVWVEPAKYYKVNNLNLNKNQYILLRRLLLLKEDETLNFGTPYINNIAIKGKVLNSFKGVKILIYKMKPKKKYRKKYGYRQKFDKLKIEGFVSI